MRRWGVYRPRLGLLLFLSAVPPTGALGLSAAEPPAATETVCPPSAADLDGSAMPQSWLLEKQVDELLRGETPPGLQDHVAFAHAGEPTLWAAWHRRQGRVVAGLRSLTHHTTTLELFGVEIEEEHLARLLSASSGIWSTVDAVMLSGSRIALTSESHDLGKEGIGGSLLLVDVDLPSFLWIGPDISTGIPPAEREAVALRIRPEVAEAYDRTTPLSGSLTLECVTAGRISLFGVRIDGGLELAHVKARALEVSGRASIAGGVSLRRVTASRITLRNVERLSSVELRSVDAATLDLYGAAVGSALTADELVVSERFDASKATFGGPVTIQRSRIGTDFRDQPKRQLTSSLTWVEPFVMRGARFADSLLLEDVELPAGLSLDESRIVGEVAMSEIALGSDVAETRCGDQWRLSLQEAHLEKGLRLALDLNASLDLRRARVGSLDLELLPGRDGRSMGCLWLDDFTAGRESWAGLELLECDRFQASDETLGHLRQRFAVAWGEKAAKRWHKRVRRCRNR